VDGFDDNTSSKVSPVFTVISWVGSVGSGNEVGVSAVGGRVGVCSAVGAGMGDDVPQPVNRMIVINKRVVLFIVISANKYT
jgi:hypothetical protein